jgi:hypothetical protein
MATHSPLTSFVPAGQPPPNCVAVVFPDDVLLLRMLNSVSVVQSGGSS